MKNNESFLEGVAAGVLVGAAAAAVISALAGGKMKKKAKAVIKKIRASKLIKKAGKPTEKMVNETLRSIESEIDKLSRTVDDVKGKKRTKKNGGAS